MQGIPDQVRYDAFGIDPYGILPIPAFPNQGKEHSVVSSQLGKGGLQDTLPNSGRARVGSNYYFVIPGNDPESHSWTD